jgi:hypothetical protein
MKEMKRGREKEVADARRRLGDRRFLTFPRGCRGYGAILARKLVNEEIDKSKSLDEIFCPESEYGYQLAGRECKDGRPSRFKPSVPLSVRRWRPVI